LLCPSYELAARLVSPNERKAAGVRTGSTHGFSSFWRDAGIIANSTPLAKRRALGGVLLVSFSLLKEHCPSVELVEFVIGELTEVDRVRKSCPPFNACEGK